MSDHKMDIAIGVDLGGTNMRVAVFGGLVSAGASPSASTIATMLAPLAAHREPVGEPRDPETVARRLSEIIDELATSAGVGTERVPVGIGIAAMLRGYSGMVANAPNLRWRDVPFGSILGGYLGPSRPVTLYNDVNAITYGEYAFGAGIGASDVLAVFVGTGIGGGIVAGGRLVEGATNCAGEIGHVKVAYGEDAPLCACGTRGCIEAFVGGHHLQRRIRRDLAHGFDSLAVELAGGDPAVVHPGHVDEAAARGDRYALDLYAELAPLLAICLGNAVSLLNPGRLILGGGVLLGAPVFREHVVTAMQLAVTPALLEPVTIVDTVLGDDAGIIGSALLAARAGA